LALQQKLLNKPDGFIALWIPLNTIMVKVSLAGFSVENEITAKMTKCGKLWL